MFEFITLVHNQSPLFKPFVEANKRDLEEKSRVRKEVEEAKSHMDEEYLIARELERQAEENRHKMEEQKRRIQDALNQQTFQQFMSYAEQQYPGNPDQASQVTYLFIVYVFRFIGVHIPLDPLPQT